MKNKILKEIKKINFYSNYNPENTLTENLLLETPVGILSKIISRSGANNFSKIVLKNVDDMVASFKVKFGDDIMNKLIKKGGDNVDVASKAADDIVEKLYKGEPLSSKQAAHFIESAADFSVGGVTIREMVAEQFEGSKIKVLFDGMDETGKLTLRDTSPTFMHFTDDFLDATLGLNIKKIRQAIDDAAELARKEANIKKKEKIDADKIIKKELDDATEAERLASRTAFKKFWDNITFSSSGNWSAKGTLRAAFSWSVNIFIIKMGLGAMFAIFGGPLFGLLVSAIVPLTLHLIGAALPKSWKNFVKRLSILKLSGKEVVEDISPGIKKWNRADYFKKWIVSKSGGKAPHFMLSKGFWFILTVYGMWFAFLDGKVGAAIDWITGGRLAGDVDGYMKMIRGGTYGDATIQGVLNGELYETLYNTEPVGGLAELGIEFDENVITQCAERLIEQLMVWKYVAKIPLYGEIGRIEFIEGYTIGSADVEKGEEYVLEFFSNSPSLLFVSAVAAKIKEITTTGEQPTTLMGLIDGYHASKDHYIYDIIMLEKEERQYNIDFSAVKAALQGLPLLDGSVDAFILDMYDSVMAGEMVGQMQAHVQSQQLNCQEKQALLDKTFGSTLIGINDTLKELGGEGSGVNLEFDCDSDTLAVIYADQINATKVMKRMAKRAPMEGVFRHKRVDGYEKFALRFGVKEVTKDWVELSADFTPRDLFGSGMSASQKDIEESSEKGIMYYTSQQQRRNWCPALIRWYGISEKNLFVGEKCRELFFSQMPILKTIAGAELSGYDGKIKFVNKEGLQIKMDKLNLDTKVVDERKNIVGLGRLLIENRKTYTNGGTI